MRMPLVLFVSSFEAFSRAIREVQRTFDQGVGPMLGAPVAPTGASSANPIESSAESASEAPTVPDTNLQLFSQRPSREEMAMPSQWIGNCDASDGNGYDLSGDDLKTVRYRIIFNKADLENNFVEETEVVSYSTNGASFGGLKVAHFILD